MIAEILEDLERPLLQYVISYTGNVEVARDIVQEAFIKLQKHFNKLDERYRTAWLYKVCRNSALDWKRRHKRIVEIEDHVLEQHSCPELWPSARLERKEQVSYVMELVEALPANQKEVVRLSYQSQLSYKEISEITGLSVSNVGYLLSTALKTLREKTKRSQNYGHLVLMETAK